MDMKRLPSPTSVEALNPRKRAKINIPSADLNSLRSMLDKWAKMAGKNAQDDDPDQYIGLFLTQLVTALSETSVKGKFIPSLVLKDACDIAKGLKSKEDAVGMLVDGRWESFLDLPELQIQSQLPPQTQPDPFIDSPVPPPDPQFVVIAGAWRLQYEGKSHQLLWDHILDAHAKSQNLYALYCAIIQSSGMGKSRLIDELAKERFVIPINIRRDKVGWPPEDEGVRIFLTKTPTSSSSPTGSSAGFDVAQTMPSDNNVPPNGEEERRDEYQRFQAFFIALFVEIALALVEERRRSIKGPNSFLFADHVGMCMWFQAYMAPEQKSLTHNHRRKQLYQRVISRAEKVRKYLTVVETDPVTGAIQLPRETRAATSTRASQISPNPKSELKMESISKDLLAPLIDPEVNDDYAAKTVNITDLSNRFVSFLHDFYPPEHTPPVEVVCAFDEAHTLSFKEEEVQQDAFPTFRRAIRQFTKSIFSVFLSTNAKISKFHPHAADESSNRILTRVFTIASPFIALPFDILVKRIEKTGFDLSNAVTIEYMAQFGRPMWASHIRAGILEGQDYSSLLVPFAAQKLLGRPPTECRNLNDNESLAVLSTLLALDYRSQTVNDRENEEVQVAHHMRVCFHVSKDFHTIVTASPSEPILAEGALLCLRNSEVKPGKMLSKVLGRSLVAAGERGEHVAALLCLKASLDARTSRTSAMLPLLDFLKALLREDVSKFRPNIPSRGRSSLGTAFKSAYVYFNHVVKLGTHGVAQASLLWGAMARGALIVLANGHTGADLLIPVCMGEHVTSDSVTYIILQIKRDMSITLKHAGGLISGMDPYSIGLYPFDHQLKHPIIRLVMSFYSKANTVSVQASEMVSSRVDSSSSNNDPLPSDPQATFTSYDIWCGGISEEVYACMTEDEVGDYLTALRICTPLSKMLSAASKGVQAVHRSQLPMFSLQKEHWSWANYVGERPVVAVESDEVTDE